MKKKLKTPSDYAQFYFRINEEDKKDIDEKVDEIFDIQKNKLRKNDYQPKRNKIIQEALMKGLIQLKKEILKR